MSRRVIAHLVVRNEAHRWLEAVLSSLDGAVDAVHVYDDLSTDRSDVLAASAGAIVTRRLPYVPSWAEDEGACRQAGWNAMEEALRPGTGDWILAIDADELLVSSPEGLAPAIDKAEYDDALAVTVPIPEIFGLDYHRPNLAQPLARVDGFWASLAQPRLVAHRPMSVFRTMKRACGSVPAYALEGRRSHHNRGVELLHLGYVDPEDRQEKAKRYEGDRRHGAAHVASILGVPTLTPWPGGTIPVWRGWRA